MFLPVKTFCVFAMTLALSSSLMIGSLNAQRQAHDARDEVRQLVERVGKHSSYLRRHLNQMMVEGDEERKEVVEMSREFLEEYQEVESERGRQAAQLWCRLFEAELSLDDFLTASEEHGIDEQKLRVKLQQVFDAEVKFEKTELRFLDDVEEREELREYLAERIENREEEIADLVAEFRAEIEGGEHEEQNERKRLPTAQLYLPTKPVGISPDEISNSQHWDFEEKVLPLLSKACYDCHGEGSNDGNLNIELLLTDLPLVKNRERWEHVVAQIENRTMPPDDIGAVSDGDRKVVAAWLRNQLENFDYASVVEPGFESAKRLTHEEYNNTIRDLIGIDLRPADRLPADMSTESGFDNSANSLFLNDALMERYLGLAESVIQDAFPANNRSSGQQMAWNKLFVRVPGNGVSESNAAAAIFKNFLPRAFRMKVDAAEIQTIVDRFTKYRQGGSDFSEAILACIQTSLSSPRFLLRVEAVHADNEGVFRVDSYALANRLSYFLWASMPDERLFELAANDKLLQPEVIEAEVLRMLADPRASSLGDSFAGQWLGFEHLGTRIRLDPIDNPWCTDSLMDSMKMETAMFFVSLLRENQSLEQLIDPDYTFLNEELARYYRIENVRGSEMRRVSLNSRIRGGIFSQASVLAVTSFPDRTSPVTRGAWVLTNVLGKRPPNPPPNASEFNDELASEEDLTQRQKMELHRRKPNCAACHDQIDPLGFALENYDLFGRYRTRSEDGHRIDAFAKLQDGTEFTGAKGLKQYIVENRMKEVLTQLTRKLLAYALGRQLEYYDEESVQKIVDAVIENEWRMQTLPLEIAKSYPFQYKRLRREPAKRTKEAGEAK